MLWYNNYYAYTLQFCQKDTLELSLYMILIVFLVIWKCN